MIEVLIIISVLVIFALALKIVALQAHMEGFRKAQQSAKGNTGSDVTMRIVKVLAIIGLFAICGICFYLESITLALAK